MDHKKTHASYPAEGLKFIAEDPAKTPRRYT